MQGGVGFVWDTTCKNLQKTRYVGLHNGFFVGQQPTGIPHICSSFFSKGRLGCDRPAPAVSGRGGRGNGAGRARDGAGVGMYIAIRRICRQIGYRDDRPTVERARHGAYTTYAHFLHDVRTFPTRRTHSPRPRRC